MTEASDRIAQHAKANAAMHRARVIERVTNGLRDPYGPGAKFECVTYEKLGKVHQVTGYLTIDDERWAFCKGYKNPDYSPDIRVSVKVPGRILKSRTRRKGIRNISDLQRAYEKYGLELPYSQVNNGT